MLLISQLICLKGDVIIKHHLWYPFHVRGGEILALESHKSCIVLYYFSTIFSVPV